MDIVADYIADARGRRPNLPEGASYTNARYDVPGAGKVTVTLTKGAELSHQLDDLKNRLDQVQPEPGGPIKKLEEVVSDLAARVEALEQTA